MDINEQSLKNIFGEQREEFQKHVDKTMGEQREEFQRYLGILKEDFDSKVTLIAEQYTSIKETLASHTEMIGSTKEDIEIMKVDIAFIKGGLKKKVDAEEFEMLENRVALLEAKGRS